MPHRIILTMDDVDRIAAEHLAGFVRLTLNSLEDAGADEMETGQWCRRFLTRYEAGAQGRTKRRPRNRRATDRAALRLIHRGF